MLLFLVDISGIVSVPVVIIVLAFLGFAIKKLLKLKTCQQVTFQLNIHVVSITKLTLNIVVIDQLVSINEP